MRWKSDPWRVPQNQQGHSAGVALSREEQNGAGWQTPSEMASYSTRRAGKAWSAERGDHCALRGEGRAGRASPSRQASGGPQAQAPPQPTPEPSGGILSRGKGPGAALPCVDTDAHSLPSGGSSLGSAQVAFPGTHGMCPLLAWGSGLRRGVCMPTT